MTVCTYRLHSVQGFCLSHSLVTALVWSTHGTCRARLSVPVRAEFCPPTRAPFSVAQGESTSLPWTAVQSLWSEGTGGAAAGRQPRRAQRQEGRASQCGSNLGTSSLSWGLAARFKVFPKHCKTCKTRSVGKATPERTLLGTLGSHV